MNETGEQTGPERSTGGDEDRARGEHGDPLRDASYKIGSDAIRNQRRVLSVLLNTERVSSMRFNSRHGRGYRRFSGRIELLCDDTEYRVTTAHIRTAEQQSLDNGEKQYVEIPGGYKHA